MTPSGQDPPLVLYFSKGSSAVAAHILLEEVGARYQTLEISIPKDAHRSDSFLALNPKGRIPVLQTPHGVLTENAAILEYIAQTHPNAGMHPKTDFAQAQARSLAAYLSSTVHVAFAHHKRGARWASTPLALQDLKAQARHNLEACADYLEKELTLSPWCLGPHYSFCDPYLLLLEKWRTAVGAPLENTPNLQAHTARMRARPAVQRVLALHDLKASCVKLESK